MRTTHKTEAVPSGDVTVSYRRFGHPGLTPIMILHGANYFGHDVAAEAPLRRQAAVSRFLYDAGL
jgi:hypothetical protein